MTEDSALLFSKYLLFSSQTTWYEMHILLVMKSAKLIFTCLSYIRENDREKNGGYVIGKLAFSKLGL